LTPPLVFGLVEIERSLGGNCRRGVVYSSVPSARVLGTKKRGVSHSAGERFVELFVVVVGELGPWTVATWRWRGGLTCSVVAGS